MTSPLLNATDFASFQAKDPNWFLGAIGDTIVDFCGWHIYPVLPDTNVDTKVGSKGIIILPTLNLVSVQAVRINGTVIDPSLYTVYTTGYITYDGYNGRRARGLPVSVDMTHGYVTVPKPVAEVGFELTGRTIEKPAGVVQDIQRGPTRMKFGEFGPVLSDDQKDRLGPYTIVRV